MFLMSVFVAPAALSVLSVSPFFYLPVAFGEMMRDSDSTWLVLLLYNDREVHETDSHRAVSCYACMYPQGCFHI
jgi:hypothetical protein